MLVRCTKAEAKAHKTYQHVLDALDREATLDGLGPYPGLPRPREGFALGFRVDLGDLSWAETVLETLSLAQRVGRGWVITGAVDESRDDL